MRRLTSRNVRRRVVVRKPRTLTTSVKACRTVTPPRERTLEPGGTTTSIGWMGSTSRRCSHAAVLPAKAASGGKRERHASRRCQGSVCQPRQQYSPLPSRRHDLPLSAVRLTPKARASSSVNGRRVNSGGIRGFTPEASPPMTLGPSQPVKTRFARNASFARRNRLVLRKTHESRGDYVGSYRERRPSHPRYRHGVQPPT